MTALRSILVPIDGSAPSLAALGHALSLAADYEATVVVLNVVPSQERLTALEPAEIDRVIDAAVARGRLAIGDRVSRRTLTGDPLTQIVATAAEGFDMIVMGTHGRVGRLHALLGSVTEGVVRNAPCPVLTVRDQTCGQESFAERRHGRPTIAEQAQSPASAPDARDRGR